jgi:hypothetical protein
VRNRVLLDVPESFFARDHFFLVEDPFFLVEDPFFLVGTDRAPR